MKKENQTYNIVPADRLSNVSEYYFSRKYKEYFGYPPSQNKERE